MNTHYRSARNHQFLNVGDMNTQHILNALAKVRSGTHFYYHSDDNVLVTLLTELEVRNAARMLELEVTISRYKGQVEALATRRSAELQTRRDAYPLGVILSHSTLDDLRTIALEVARDKGLVTADTLRSAYKVRNRGFWVNGSLNIGPYLPYVFRDKRFKKIGFLRSTFPANKGRFINVWTHTAAV